MSVAEKVLVPFFQATSFPPFSPPPPLSYSYSYSCSPLALAFRLKTQVVHNIVQGQRHPSSRSPSYF